MAASDVPFEQIVPKTERDLATPARCESKHYREISAGIPARASRLEPPSPMRAGVQYRRVGLCWRAS